MTTLKITNEELPDSWLTCTLGDVTPYGSTKKVEPSNIPLDAWVLELEDIEKDTSRIIQRLTFRERKSKSTKNYFQAGDVLYGKLRPYLNKVVVADDSGYCTTEVIPLKPTAAVQSKYLFYWLKYPVFLEYVTDVSHGRLLILLNARFLFLRSPNNKKSSAGSKTCSPSPSGSKPASPPRKRQWSA